MRRQYYNIKFIGSFIILFFPIFILGQDNHVEIKYSESYNSEFIDAVLHDLQIKNDYVVSFKLASNWKSKTDYFVFTKHKDSFGAFKYVVQSFDHLKKLTINSDSLSNLWHSCIEKDLFVLRHSKDISDSCSQDTSLEGKKRYRTRYIEDSYHYYFLILSKTQMKRLDYYDPEYFEKICGNNAERQKIIQCVTLINKLVH